MKQISERERMLIARGDVALATLQAVLKTIRPALDTNSKAAEQLNAILARQPSQQQTMLSITAQVTTQTTATLHSVVELIESTNAELTVFEQSAGIADTVGDAERNVLEAIRQSSEFYANKSNEELRVLVGL